MAERSEEPSRESTEAPPVTGVRRTLLLVLALVSGACVMTVEMAGQRSLTPFFGSSTYVWTNVIGVILAALSVGYLMGGRLADRNPRPLLLLAILSVASFLCLLIPVVVHPLAGALIPEGARQESAFRVVYLGSFLVTLLLFAPPIFTLGMVPPFLVRLVTREAGEVGRASGHVYALSTVGSILGTFLPTLVFIPWIGSKCTILLAGGTLLVFSTAGIVLFASGGRKLASSALLLLLIPAALGAARPVKGGPATLAEHESPYQYVRVHAKGDALMLSLNEELETYHSLLLEGRALTGATHFDYFLFAPLHFDPELHPRLRVYVAGLAGGVVSRQLHHFFGETFRLEVDGAEIDPTVLAMGRRFFGLDSGENRNLAAYPMDARLFLENGSGKYDLILVDAYANQMYIPFQLASREFFERARGRLASGGVLCVNVADFSPRAPLLTAVRNTLARAFGRVDQVKVPGGMNYLLFASRDDVPRDSVVRRNLNRPSFASRPEAGELAALLEGALESRRSFHAEPRGTVLTDDFAPVEALMDASFREARRRMEEWKWNSP
jgi:predicted membrane-bound spermidine synthase